MLRIPRFGLKVMLVHTQEYILKYGLRYMSKIIQLITLQFMLRIGLKITQNYIRELLMQTILRFGSGQRITVGIQTALIM
jgi:hypothetical protein